jgi:penicillin-binding protein 1B
VVSALVFAGWTLWLDYRITTAFEGKRWSVPARVYARPLELFAGLHLSADNLELELKAADFRPGNGDTPGTYARNGNVFRIATDSFRFWDGVDPARDVRVALDDERVASLEDAASERDLALVRLPPAHIGNIYPAHREDRILVRLEDVPRSLVEALVAVEDHRYMEHHGVSPVGILRALVANLRAGGVVQGGSTLTQQLVKNYFLSAERTLWRKANEALMAVLLELHYSKAEILEAYLNEVYLGQDGRRAVHGFGLASRFYFGRDLQELDLAEQALLVALVRGPSYYNPRQHPQRALARRNLVLDIMGERGYAAPGAVSAAKAEPLGVTPEAASARTDYPHFVELVRRHLRRDYDEADLSSEGLRIFTTLAPHVQEATEAAMRERMAQWRDDTQGAAVVVNVDTGEVEALLGGRNPRFVGFNRALDAHRPIGSLVKPAVYLSALSHPARYGLGTLIEDTPITLQDEHGRQWTPRNYDRESHGRVTLIEALAHSYNVPAVRVGLDVGLRAVVDTLSRLGGPTPDTVYPSLLLGSVAATPLRVAAMYETLATGGFRTPLRSVRAVMTPAGELLSRYPLTVDRVVEAEPVYLVNRALQQVVREGTAQGLRRWVSPELGVAGKTGTTDGLRDSWFAGYTGDRLGVVWVGRDDNGRTGLTGTTGAMTVWGELFSRLQSRPLELTPPPGIRMVWIEEDTGRLAARHCDGAIALPYVAGHAPAQSSPCVDDRGLVDRAANWMRGLFE